MWLSLGAFDPLCIVRWMSALEDIASVRTILLMRWRTSTTACSDVLRMNHCVCLCMADAYNLFASVARVHRASKAGDVDITLF